MLYADLARPPREVAGERKRHQQLQPTQPGAPDLAGGTGVQRYGLQPCSTSSKSRIAWSSVIFHVQISPAFAPPCTNAAQFSESNWAPGKLNRPPPWSSSP